MYVGILRDYNYEQMYEIMRPCSVLESAKPRQKCGYFQELGYRGLTQIDQESCAENLRPQS